ncbi:hypothetical protein J6590_053020 [Homalodisca vitripennis]|nr:hypothetical protein J6590_053020 [Homalodisca vitripennis]
MPAAWEQGWHYLRNSSSAPISCRQTVLYCISSAVLTVTYGPAPASRRSDLARKFAQPAETSQQNRTSRQLIYVNPRRLRYRRSLRSPCKLTSPHQSVPATPCSHLLGADLLLHRAC